MSTPGPQAWRNQIFQANQANVGGVVRRSRSDVDTLGGGIAAIVADARSRNFHVIETGGQVVILCHQGEIVIHC